MSSLPSSDLKSPDRADSPISEPSIHIEPVTSTPISTSENVTPRDETPRDDQSDHSLPVPKESRKGTSMASLYGDYVCISVETTRKFKKMKPKDFNIEPFKLTRHVLYKITHDQMTVEHQEHFIREILDTEPELTKKALVKRNEEKVNINMNHSTHTERSLGGKIKAGPTGGEIDLNKKNVDEQSSSMQGAVYRNLDYDPTLTNPFEQYEENAQILKKGIEVETFKKGDILIVHEVKPGIVTINATYRFIPVVGFRNS